MTQFAIFVIFVSNRKNGRGSEPLPNIWKKTEEEEKLPAKADSLPRNIQLNDQIENLEKTETDDNEVAAVNVSEVEEHPEG